MSQNMLNVVAALWLAFEVWRTIGESTRRGAVADRHSSSVIVVALLVSLASMFWLSARSIWPIAGTQAMQYVGLAMMIGGLALRVWSVISLGRFFTGTVMIQPDHHLVYAGPYKKLRHPSYTAMTLGLLGYAVSTNSAAAVLAVFIGAVMGFGYRILVEERALVEAFGEDYLIYAESTKRLIPYVF